MTARRTSAALGAATSHDVDFARAFEAAPFGLAVLDRELRFVCCNEALAEMNGVPAADHTGRTIHEIVPSLAEDAEARIRSALTSGKAVADLPVRGPSAKYPGQVRSWRESITPLADADGTVTHLLVSVQEVTALEEAEAALQEREATFDAFQQVSVDGFAILRAVREPTGRIVDFTWDYANPAAQNMVDAGPLAGRSIRSLMTADFDRAEVFPLYVRVLQQEATEEIEHWYQTGDTSRCFSSNITRIDEDRVAVATRDVTVARTAEQRTRLVMNEFRHRVKNVLTVVSSLVVQAARASSDIESLKSTLLRQLQAMGSAQDLLHEDGSLDANLASVASAALKPFAFSGVRLDPGPDVTLPSASVVPLVLAFHELATNASKYGALSTPNGVAHVGWSVANGRVEMHWREAGGPEVQPPANVGFGSRLLQIISRSLPRGDIRIDFAQSGFTATICFDAMEGDSAASTLL